MPALPCLKKKEDTKKDETPAGPQFTFYDQYGILRKGVTTDDGLLHDRDEELERVLGLENGWANFTPEEQRSWYIMESGWIRTWLSYVRYGTASLGESLSSPAPPPISNECLLLMAADTEAPYDRESSDFPPFKWVVKPNLIPANKDGQGHFRRVNCKVWEAFCDMYKGSGPAIKYMDEELPPPPEEPSNEETKLGGGSGEAAAGAAGGAAGGEETKAGEEKTEATAEAKASEGDAKGDEAPKEGDEKEEGQQADPTRWQDPSLWVIDQSQDRFQDKYSEKRYPKLMLADRVAKAKGAWNTKKLRKDKAAKEAEEEALLQAAEAAAASAEVVDDAATSGEETKEAGAVEEKEEEGGEESGNEDGDEDAEEEGDRFAEDLLAPPVSSDAALAAMANTSPNLSPNTARKDSMPPGRASLQPEMGEVFSDKGKETQRPVGAAKQSSEVTIINPMAQAPTAGAGSPAPPPEASKSVP